MNRQDISIRQLQVGDEPLIEQFLKPYIDSSLFLLSNLRQAGLRYAGQRFEGRWWAAVLPDGSFVGVLAHFSSNNMILQAPASQALDALFDGFRQVAARQKLVLNGIIGPGDQVERLMIGLGIDRGACAFEPLEELFRLDLAQLVMPQALLDRTVVCRRAVAVDVPLLAAWDMAYDVEALGKLPATSHTEAQARLDEAASMREWQIARRTLFVLEAAGVCVAASAFNGQIPEYVQIGGVYTPPALRGKGYARAVVAGQLQIARAEGVSRAVLFAKDPAAIRAYRSIGFQPCGRYGVALLRKPQEF